VLNIGHAFAGAFAKTVLRNPQRRMVAEREIVSRSVTELASPTALHMVTMHGAGLQALGTDNCISTGPYEPCGEWADALWDSKPVPAVQCHVSLQAVLCCSDGGSSSGDAPHSSMEAP